MGPAAYLIVGLLVMNGATYGVMKLKQIRVAEASWNAGHKAGAGSVAATTTQKAQETVSAVEQGERTAPAVSADRLKLIELCKKSASCRDRHKINGGT
jgi:hypothetical protein